MPVSSERVLVLAAMRSEMKPFLRTDLAPTVHTAVTGIGTARAEAVTRRELDAHPDVERVVMIGIAGGLGTDVGVGDLVVPERVIHGRTGDELEPEVFGDHVARGALHTSDDFITDPDRIAELRRRDVIALDMETAAVGQVCVERGIPWSVFRGLSDHVDHLPVDPAVLDLTGPEGEPRPGAVARFVVRHPVKAMGLRHLAAGSRAAIAVSTDALVAALD